MVKIKLGLADDHKEFRNAIKNLIHSETDLEVILEADDGLQLLEKLRNKTPDIILMDIRMPKMGGIEATDHIKAEYPHIKIIAFSQYDCEENIVEMNIHGVKSFIGKEDEPDELFRAIRTVYNGGIYMTEKAAAIVQNRLKVYDPESSEKSELDSGILSTLSSTELQILEHVANHKSMKDIATELEISPNTVNNHQSNIRRKLSLSGRSSLLQFALGLKKYLSKKKFK